MDNRREVQEFLTALRSRLTPERAGLTLYGRERRVPGLRREEVAQLAGVSTAYYTRMERGDLAGVSESVLFGLVGALQLDEAETIHLLNLARTATGSRRAPRTAPQGHVSAQVAQLIDAMQDVPAIALTRLGDPVGSNALGRALFPDLFSAGAAPLNHARYVFLDPRSRTFYPDWESSARRAVSSLRLLAGQDPSDHALMALIGDLETHSDDFRTFWGGHTVRIHASGTKRINHPVAGELTLSYETLNLPSTPGVAIGTYLTEPGSSSADALAMLRSWIADSESAGRSISHS